MSHPELETDIEELDQLLERERDALLAGDLEQLVQMVGQKERLVAALNATGHRDLPQLLRLNGKVKRNQLLLNGALEGIKSVSQRLAALQKVRQSLETYDREGQKQRVDMQIKHSVEKRA